jgi:hypothetical protein
MVRRYEAGKGVATEPKHGNPAMPHGRSHVLLSSYKVFFVLGRQKEPLVPRSIFAAGDFPEGLGSKRDNPAFW